MDIEHIQNAKAAVAVDADRGGGTALKLELNGHTAHVEESGSGPPVVLVHGLGGTGAGIWKHQIADLAAEFRVVTYDLRGSGGSEVTPGPVLDRPARATTCARSSSALELGRVALVGPFDGRLDRADVRGALLRRRLAPWSGSARRRSSPTRRARACETRAATVEAEGMARGRRDGRDERRVADVPRGRPAGVPGASSRCSRRNDPQGYAAQCRALVGLDIASQLAEIAAPVLLISGDRDGVSPPAVDRGERRSHPGRRASRSSRTAAIS